ncbi:MAG: NAD(P)/FAD-dependent oxidoreductase [bacterium]
MIVIVGGGLAGLACATQLHRQGADFLVVEAATTVGGRQRTTRRDGFLLDHGFQVVLSSYGVVSELCDVTKLRPRWFESGALLYNGNRLEHLASPLEKPLSVLRTGALRVGDKIRLALLGLELLLTPARAFAASSASSKDISARTFLERRGFSQEFFHRFAQPFFGGVLLDNDLSSSAGLFLSYFKKFLTGRAWIPAAGIQALPEAIAEKLPLGAIRTGTRVVRLQAAWTGVVLENGETLRADKIVLALDEPSLCRLLERPAPQSPRETTVVYFKSRASLYGRPCLVLPEGEGKRARHFAQLSNVAPEVAPHGWHLISATVLERRGLSSEDLARAVSQEIGAVFPHAGASLEHLETIHVPYATPAQPPGFAARNAFPDLPPNVYACGDWERGASIESALRSGIDTAHRVLRG